jgi:hypothetical protein
MRRRMPKQLAANRGRVDQARAVSVAPERRLHEERSGLLERCDDFVFFCPRC